MATHRGHRVHVHVHIGHKHTTGAQMGAGGGRKRRQRAKGSRKGRKMSALQASYFGGGGSRKGR